MKSDFILLIEAHMRNELFVKNGELQKNKLWERTFISRQILRHEKGCLFDLKDHIRAMVYSMLSSGIHWARIEKYTDEESGKMPEIDEIFHNYDEDFLLNCDPQNLVIKIFDKHCGSPYTKRQMTALVQNNISMLKSFENRYGSIDAYYQTFIDKDKSLKSLVKTLSSPQSPNKFVQMGEALTAEYLKNVGYDIAKPDRHICRILGVERLAFSQKENVPPYDAIDIVTKIADKIGRKAAEVDYILWSYCANGYGEVCTKNKPRCNNCVIQDLCNRLGDT